MALRKTMYLCSVLFLSLILVVGSSCDDEKSDPSEQELTFQKLTTGKWNLASAQVDGVGATDIYNGLSLTFVEQTFTAAGGGAIWPETGSWAFLEGSSSVILMDAKTREVSVTIVVLNNSTLAIEFQWDKTTLGSGRIGSIAGTHRFVFTH